MTAVFDFDSLGQRYKFDPSPDGSGYPFVLLLTLSDCLTAHLAQKIASSNIIYYKEFGQFASLGLNEQQVPGSLNDNEQNQMLASKKNVFLPHGNK